MAMTPPRTSSPLFQILGRPHAAHVPCVNQKALEELLTILDRPLGDSGRCTLLLAPRAGYGKSHLLCQAQETLRRSHECIPLHSSDGMSFDATSTLENVITPLTRTLPGASGITALDLLARKFFAVGLEPLVRSGEVPCQNRDSALLALMQRPLETFDFHHPAAVTAHWTRHHFDALSPRLTTEISQLLGLSLRESAFWTDSLFRYAATSPEEPARIAALMQSVLRMESLNPHDRLCSLLHILSQWQRVVIVVDELEGLSANPGAALRLATFLTSLRHGAERIDVVLSLNDDIWENAFLPRLSAGLLDRLTETTVRLFPLDREQALQLLKSRYPHATLDDLSRLPIEGDIYARGLLRAAAQMPPQPIPSLSTTPFTPLSSTLPSVLSAPFLEPATPKEIRESTPVAPPASPTVPLLPPSAEIVPAVKPTIFPSPPPTAESATFSEPTTPVTQATSAWWTVPAPQVANPFSTPPVAPTNESTLVIDSNTTTSLASFPAGVSAITTSPLPRVSPSGSSPVPSVPHPEASTLTPQNLDPVEALLQDLRQCYGNPDTIPPTQ